MAGQIQLLILGGWNLAGQYATERWVFEYSHGQSLDLSNFGRTAVEVDQGLDVAVPWTNIASTLDGGQHVFSNGDRHKAHDFSFFGNLNIGWSF